MIENVVILPEAVDDLAESRAWYEGRIIGLGERFLSHVDDCIERIQRNPELYERVYKDYRRAICIASPTWSFMSSMSIRLWFTQSFTLPRTRRSGADA